MRRGNLIAIGAIAAALATTAGCRSDRSVPAPNRHNVSGHTTRTTDRVPDARDSSRSTDRSIDAASPVPIASPAKDDAGRVNQSGVDDAANSTAGPNSGGTTDKLPDTTPSPVNPAATATPMQSKY